MAYITLNWFSYENGDLEISWKSKSKFHWQVALDVVKSTPQSQYFPEYKHWIIREQFRNEFIKSLETLENNFSIQCVEESKNDVWGNIKLDLVSPDELKKCDTIKPIETKYKGYTFRSRLEARWAVFFDALDIKWEYEPEGFKLSDGTYYLPDFYLPTFSSGMYCEVKPIGGDFSKAKQFCLDSKKRVWKCEGVPEYRSYTIFEVYPFDDEGNPCELRVVEDCGVPNHDQAYKENRMFVQPGYENKDGTIPEEYWMPHYEHAVEKSHSARFEHGESG